MWTHSGSKQGCDLPSQKEGGEQRVGLHCEHIHCRDRRKGNPLAKRELDPDLEL